ncbi:Y-box-binding protein 2-A-like [Musca vetustissima]|uniref:Y-box-binding protein 2-A-like n=1 Tax=Musca vetustissima TaxID=27455 RepID=UPI002AB71EA9|nr:Y-box-binding protein 2-A-like [Musca vetustissima]
MQKIKEEPEKQEVPELVEPGGTAGANPEMTAISTRDAAVYAVVDDDRGAEHEVGLDSFQQKRVYNPAGRSSQSKKAVRSVGDGVIVGFDVVIGEIGSEAANVTGLFGEPVRGSQFSADKQRRNRNTPRPRWTRRSQTQQSFTSSK